MITSEFSNGKKKFVFEFHISGSARKKYKFDDLLFAFNGNVIIANFPAARQLAKKINDKRPSTAAVRTGQLNAMGLIDEIYHFILREYENKKNINVFPRALHALQAELGKENFRNALLKFVEEFPPADVYRNNKNAEEYLDGSTDGRSHMAVTLEEMLLLHIANFNPANAPFKELFDDTNLVKLSPYKELMTGMEKFFQNEIPIGSENLPLFDFLRLPIITNPLSLEEQLKYIQLKWKDILPEKFLSRILSSMDLIKEDIRFDSFGGGGAPTIAPSYKSKISGDIFTLGKSGFNYAADSLDSYAEPERFTEDAGWMPRVVLLAKNVFVWLDQLSKQYGRSIHRLDEIPDEVLDTLQRWNFTGLWLIGLWERSMASQKIKQWTGNPEAVPSAYSLYDYVIAYDLGGEDAFQNLNERCKQRGIRLSSDMVPNHMGIESKWVIEHPDYFIQAEYPPFPNYKFTGADLSDDPRVQIRIEDGYWNRSDAAVVFQRIENSTGEVKYFYHGNDGTSMPWNDTAQLNLLKAEVREAVIQTIFHVARKTSIIRFDAAMTLAKKHFQRLWYPQPGTGGDIPSRADYALTRAEFDSFFPNEFWREVVDRINAEMPDTLLLAEAFWLMEGYFVRTLGMHRVYNSAFMHMLMKEENDKYRDAITNTLEYNPEILKRYVNFMSNPDEETAIKQFGTDDKYFGVCMLMVTLPGLPMFAHGQIEGYTEKYGMEYRRAYYNEWPNEWLVRRHEAEIFPLTGKRYLFSQVKDFWFYDFIDGSGNCNENVFAYSNTARGERAVIFYNNKFDETAGRIRFSTGKAVHTIHGDDREVKYTDLADALYINSSDGVYYIFREHRTKLEYIRSGREIKEQGLYVELKAFKYEIFLDFTEVRDTNGDYSSLESFLGGRGVPSLTETMLEIKLAPVYDLFGHMFDSKILENLSELSVTQEDAKRVEDNIKFMTNRFNLFLNLVIKHMEIKGNSEPVINAFSAGLRSLQSLNKSFIEPKFWQIKPLQTLMLNLDKNYPQNSLIYLIMTALYNLGKIESEENFNTRSLQIFDKLNLASPLMKILRRFGRSEDELVCDLYMIRLLIKFGKGLILQTPDDEVHEQDANIRLFKELLLDPDALELLHVNEYQGIKYYSKENLEDLISWIYTINVMLAFRESDINSQNDELKKRITALYNFSNDLKVMSAASKYQLDLLLGNL
jgi:glycosidase